MESVGAVAERETVLRVLMHSGIWSHTIAEDCYLVTQQR